MSDRPIVVNEGGGPIYYRASALGGCLRALALARQGYEQLPPPAQMQKVFDAGHEAERQAWVKGILKGRAQEFCQLQISDSIWVTGHMDAWTPYRIQELKSQSEAEWGPIELSDLWNRYKYQVSVYMHATNLPCDIIRVQRDPSGDITRQATQTFDTPPVSLVDIRQRIFQVELLARKDLTEVECNPVEFPCPFYYTHVGKPEEIRENVTDKEASVLAREYQRLKVEKAAMEGRVKTARQALLTWIEGQGKNRVKLDDGWLLTRYEVKGKHVEYDREGYFALRVTEPKKEEDDGG